jgi:hypothetical protein
MNGAKDSEKNSVSIFRDKVRRARMRSGAGQLLEKVAAQ